jgi:uncharacterized membrane protein
MNRGVRSALAISVVVNVLLAGVLLGNVSQRYIAPAAKSFDVAAALGRLPSDKRSLYETIMGKAKQNMDAARKQIDETKKQAIAILKTEPFDEQAYMAQVQKIGGMIVEMKKHLAESVVELAKQLTGEERAVLADIVSHPPFALTPGMLSQLGSAAGNQ